MFKTGLSLLSSFLFSLQCWLCYYTQLSLCLLGSTFILSPLSFQLQSVSSLFQLSVLHCLTNPFLPTDIVSCQLSIISITTPSSGIHLVGITCPSADLASIIAPTMPQHPLDWYSGFKFSRTSYSYQIPCKCTRNLVTLKPPILSFWCTISKSAQFSLQISQKWSQLLPVHICTLSLAHKCLDMY